MNRKEIIQRIELLRDVFAYSLINHNLSRGQRICLSQERAAWLEVLDLIDVEDTSPRYTIPEHLEYTVKGVAQIIEQIGWVKPEYLPEF